MALVASQRRFGPAGATAVLALLIAVTAGILYGSQAWFPAVDKLAPVKAANDLNATATAARDAGSGRKVKANENPVVITPRAKTNDTENNRAPKNTEEIAVTSRPEKNALPLKSENRAGQESQNRTPRKSLQRVGAPSIRFPKPEVHDNAPAPTPVSRNRVYETPSGMAATTAPRFFRAADGTQIVK